MPFKKLKLMEPLLRAVKSEGYTIPTAIQEQAIPLVLQGRDLFGCAQTGTGKTAAFALPILQLLHEQNVAGTHAQEVAPAHKTPTAHGHEARRTQGSAPRPIRALILTPTRELAAQIDESFRVYGQHMGLRHTVVFGGVGKGPQIQALRNGVDILVATPGRLLDLLGQRVLSLREIKILVLDEGDRMLDMGFIHDIRRILAVVPPKRQTMMFSATLPKEIRVMAEQILTNPAEVRIPSESPAADTVKQGLYYIDMGSKIELLEQVLKDPTVTRALVFTRTKHRADQVTKRLISAGVSAEAIHSNKSQNARTKALDNFKRARTRVLVASDIAARGLDVDNISHVVNYDVPNMAETYVHRIGRTGRAGSSGQALTFCGNEERGELRDIEKLLGRSIPVLQHSLKGITPGEGDSTPRRQYGRPQQRRGFGRAPASSGHAAAGKTPTTPPGRKEHPWQGKTSSRRRKRR